MKIKMVTLSLLLLLVFSIPVFADGITHSGGRTCPEGQSCLVNETPGDENTTNDIVIFKDVLLFLKTIIFS